MRKAILRKKKTTTSLAKFLSASYLLHFWFCHAHVISSQHFPVRKLSNIWRLFDKFILVHGDHGYNIECIHVLQPWNISIIIKKYVKDITWPCRDIKLIPSPVAKYGKFVSPSGYICNVLILLYKHQRHTKPFHFSTFLWKVRFNM